MPHPLFVLDVDRCTGCSACVLACNNENPVARDLSWREVQTFNRQRFPASPVFHYSLACNHCLDPACMTACPANAYRKDESTGAVLVDSERCIGCRYCAWVCPYDAPRFNTGAGVMEKCTFCHHRQENSLEPACVVACPTDALSFEVDGAPQAVSRPGFPEVGLRPAVRVVGRRRGAAPKTTSGVDHAPHWTPRRSLDWSGLWKEWSLWLFSLVATLLVAWFAAATAQAVEITLPIFASIGTLAMATSVLHLGRIGRLWRSILGIRGSWVSREIVLFSAFFFSACALTFRPIGAIADWFVVAFGLAALFSMDMVYRIPGQPVRTVPHSAMASLTAALYIGVFLSSPALVGPVAVAKAVLYLSRSEHPRPGFLFYGPIRIVAGLVVPSALLVWGFGAFGIAIAAAISGEVIDRAEFYASIWFLTPAVQIERDLEVEGMNPTPHRSPS